MVESLCILNDPICKTTLREQRTARCVTLLDYYSTKRAVSLSQKQNKNQNQIKIWSPKQRRAYQRIMSGYKLTKYMRGTLRFMTMTTSNNAKNCDLKRDFNVLVKRIRRRASQFEYIRIVTDEGNGVLHILFRGCYIPRSWLKEQWFDIHLSYMVDIRSVKRYHCSYVVNQYLCGQTSFVRYSMSCSWVFRGFVGVWHNFCKWYYEDRLRLWDSYLKNYAYGLCQCKLSDFG